MAALLAVELLGVPSCGGDTASERELRRTDRLIAQGQFAEALTILDALRGRDGAEPLLFRQAARANAGLGRLAEETRAWEEFVRTSPVPGDGCLRLAELYRIQNEPAKVGPLAGACLAVDPAQPELIGELARAHDALGNPAAAEQDLQRAIRLDPGNPELRVRLAERLLDSRRYDEARTHADAALRVSPGWARAERIIVAAANGRGAP